MIALQRACLQLSWVASAQGRVVHRHACQKNCKVLARFHTCNPREMPLQLGGQSKAWGLHIEKRA
jgi:hypothetical protein